MNNQKIRLQKYLASCGIASRRNSEKLILDGRISVNGKVIDKMGHKIDPSVDLVKFDDKLVRPKKSNISLILNKPAGYVSTMHDPQGRACVADLVPTNKYPSLFPVGRLDRLTCGLLIFTTDGQLGQDILHPKNEVDKTYEVVIDGRLEQNSDEIKKLENGVLIKSGKTSKCKIEILEHFAFNKYLNFENEFFKNCASYKDRDSLPSAKELINNTFTRLNITIHEGKNRQIRRMFETIDKNVLLLTRKSLGNLKLNTLEVGKWRKLEEEEVEQIKL